MNTKISKLSELSDIIVKKSRLDEGVLNFVTRFKLGILLKSFSSLKEQGYSLLSIISKILICLGELNIYAEFTKKIILPETI